MAEGVTYRPVEAPNLTRPRTHGIMSVARTVDVPDLSDVLAGIGYAVDCSSDYEIAVGACVDIGPDTPETTLNQFHRDPFTLSVADICALGYTKAMQDSRARAKLLRLEQAATAEALASGGLTQSFGAQEDVELLAEEPVSLRCAIGLIDAWGAERGIPSVAYAPIESSALLAGVTTQSGVLISRANTRIALSPYIGSTAPADGPDAPWWMWATGPIRLLRGPVVTSWESIPTENTYISRAHRTIIPDWTCGIAAVPIEDFC